MVLVESVRKESRRSVGKLSVVGGIVSIGLSFLLKQEGLSLFLYGLVFRRFSWLLIRLLLLGGVLVLALFFAMRPFWCEQQNRFASILTILIISLLFIRELVTGLLITAGVFLYLILGLFLKALM